MINLIFFDLFADSDLIYPLNNHQAVN